MKVVLLFLCCGMLLTTADTAAQQFINGGFEPAGSLTPCIDNPKATYNANMGNNWAVGNAANMQVADNSCSKGAPIDGSYFGVLKYDVPYGNKIVFKLDQPLKAGTDYSCSIHYKIPAGIPPATGSLRYGYSKDSTSTDSISGYTDNISTETWQEDTLSLSPTQSWQYVWIEFSVLAGDPYTVHVDGLKMHLTPSGINDIEHTKALSLSPNPSMGSTTLTVSKAITMPYTLEVYDITGKTLLKKSNLQDKKTTIDMTSVSSGMFLLKITDSKQQTHTSKLMVQ